MPDPLVMIPITAIAAAILYFGRHELRRRRLVCPNTGTEADVDVVQRYQQPNRPVRITACSLLPGVKKLTCHGGCLRRRS